MQKTVYKVLFIYMKNMENMNLGTERIEPSENASQNLAEKNVEMHDTDSITTERESLIMDKRTLSQKAEDITIRGKEISEKALKSDEFRMITAKKHGTEEEYEKAKELLKAHIENYENTYKAKYEKQLDEETGDVDYAEELYEHL